MREQRLTSSTLTALFRPAEAGVTLFAGGHHIAVTLADGRIRLRALGH